VAGLRLFRSSDGLNRIPGSWVLRSTPGFRSAHVLQFWVSQAAFCGGFRAGKCRSRLSAISQFLSEGRDEVGGESEGVAVVNCFLIAGTALGVVLLPMEVVVREMERASSVRLKFATSCCVLCRGLRP